MSYFHNLESFLTTHTALQDTQEMPGNTWEVKEVTRVGAQLLALLMLNRELSMWIWVNFVYILPGTLICELFDMSSFPPLLPPVVQSCPPLSSEEEALHCPVRRKPMEARKYLRLEVSFFRISLWAWHLSWAQPGSAAITGNLGVVVDTGWEGTGFQKGWREATAHQNNPRLSGRDWQAGSGRGPAEEGNARRRGSERAARTPSAKLEGRGTVCCKL